MSKNIYGVFCGSTVVLSSVDKRNSPDMGKTWAQYDLSDFGRRSPVRFHKKNSDGWFRIDLRTGWIKRADVLFIKPKP